MRQNASLLPLWVCLFLRRRDRELRALQLEPKYVHSSVLRSLTAAELDVIALPLLDASAKSPVQVASVTVECELAVIIHVDLVAFGARPGGKSKLLMLVHVAVQLGLALLVVEYQHFEVKLVGSMSQAYTPGHHRRDLGLQSFEKHKNDKPNKNKKSNTSSLAIVCVNCAWLALSF